MTVWVVTDGRTVFSLHATRAGADDAWGEPLEAAQGDDEWERLSESLTVEPIELRP